MTKALLTIEQAAAALSVPRGSLKAAAEQHGMLIRMGRAIRLDPETLEELVKLCREPQKAPVSTGGHARTSGSSATRAVPIDQRAHQIAARLKGHYTASTPKPESSRGL
jgi:hypothetical protein